VAARKHIPPAVQARVVTECIRRCCLCVYLDKVGEAKAGQIAHVDRDPSNAEFENLAWLCLEHHDRYDSKSSQSKNFLPAELRIYRDRLRKSVEKGEIGQVESELRFRVNPGWDGRNLSAQFQLECLGGSPIKIAVWFCRWSENGRLRFAESISPCLPVVMSHLQDFSFSAVLGDFAPDQLIELGVKASDGRVWSRSAVEMDQLPAAQHRYGKLQHLLPPEKYASLADVEGQSISVKYETRESVVPGRLCLVARITNTGTAVMPVIGAALEWKFSPRRLVSRDAMPSVAEMGGNVSIPTNWHVAELAPTLSKEITIDGGWASMLVDAASADVEEDDLVLRLFVSRRVAWDCKGDGLREAVRAVAASILA